MTSTGRQHCPGATPAPAEHGLSKLAGRTVPPPPPPVLPTTPTVIGEPPRRTDEDVLTRLTAIEHRLHQVSTQLDTTISVLLSQLDNICANLQTSQRDREGTRADSAASGE